MRRDLYAEVSARIVAELERGAAPWVRPWQFDSRRKHAVQCSFKQTLLGLQRYFALAFPKSRLANAAVPHVQAGNRGRRKRAEGRARNKGHFRQAVADKGWRRRRNRNSLDPDAPRIYRFQRAQCEGLPDSIKSGKPMRVRNPDTRDALADEFLRSTGADIREGHGEAYYVPSHDFISMPAFEAFKGADHFYNVAFHELTHWTGHKSRLDRDLKHRFGERAYAAEELVAELAPRSSARSSVLTAMSATPATSPPGLIF